MAVIVNLALIITNRFLPINVTVIKNHKDVQIFQESLLQ